MKSLHNEKEIIVGVIPVSLNKRILQSSTELSISHNIITISGGKAKLSCNYIKFHKHYLYLYFENFV